MKLNKKTRTIIICISAALVAITALVCALTLMPGAPREATIKIPTGATESMTADTLTLYFGKDYSAKVMKLARMQGFDSKKRSGAYLIAKGMSPLRAARCIARGGQTPVKVTINGFRDRSRLVNAIASKFEFSPAALDSALSDTSFLSEYGLSPTQGMAFFLNDTYEFYWNTTPRKMLKKMGVAYKKFWNDDRLQKCRALGLSPAEIAIIASITDEETNVAEEKGAIGRLYINRLHKGMRLQADPTVRFALGDFNIKRVTEKHLRTDSPYNTYRNGGLPPGPIRTISRATVDSILNSRPSPYLYMCADPDFSGRHKFTVTFDEHKANAEAYRKELDRRGIGK